MGFDAGGDGGKVGEELYVIVAAIAEEVEFVGKGEAVVNGAKANSNIIVILVYLHLKVNLCAVLTFY